MARWALLIVALFLLAACRQTTARRSLDEEIHSVWDAHFAHLAAEPVAREENLVAVYALRVASLPGAIAAGSEEERTLVRGYLLEWEIENKAEGFTYSLYQVLDRAGESRAWMAAESQAAYDVAGAETTIATMIALGSPRERLWNLSAEDLDRLQHTGRERAGLTTLCRRILGLKEQVDLTVRSAAFLRQEAAKTQKDYDALGGAWRRRDPPDEYVPWGSYRPGPPPGEE